MIHAYSELYVDSAQKILGDAVDFSVHTLGMSLEKFSMLFDISGASKQFGMGNPMYVAGITGPEFVELILQECGIPGYEAEPELCLHKSPEYWAGWALAEQGFILSDGRAS